MCPSLPPPPPLQVQHLQGGEHGDEADIGHLVEGQVQLSQLCECREAVEVSQSATRQPQHRHPGQAGSQVTHTLHYTPHQPQLLQARQVHSCEEEGGGGGGGGGTARNTNNNLVRFMIYDLLGTHHQNTSNHYI